MTAEIEKMIGEVKIRKETKKITEALLFDAIYDLCKDSRFSRPKSLERNFHDIISEAEVSYPAEYVVAVRSGNLLAFAFDLDMPEAGKYIRRIRTENAGREEVFPRVKNSEVFSTGTTYNYRFSYVLAETKQ